MKTLKYGKHTPRFKTKVTPDIYYGSVDWAFRSPTCKTTLLLLGTRDLKLLSKAIPKPWFNIAILMGTTNIDEKLKALPKDHKYFHYLGESKNSKFAARMAKKHIAAQQLELSYYDIHDILDNEPYKDDYRRMKRDNMDGLVRKVFRDSAALTTVNDGIALKFVELNQDLKDEMPFKEYDDFVVRYEIIALDF